MAWARWLSPCLVGPEMNRSLVFDLATATFVSRHDDALFLLVEVEIEIIEGHLRIAKLRLFLPPFYQSVAATSQFVGHYSLRCR